MIVMEYTLISNGSANSATLAINTGGLKSVTINTAGSNYNVGDVLIIIGGASSATFAVTKVTPTGGISSLSLRYAGYGYSSTGNNVSTTVTLISVAAEW